MQRRAFLFACSSGAVVFARSLSALAQGGAARGVAPDGLVEDLVAGNRILAMEGVLDAMGHISVRHSARPERFLLARSMAPELVTTADILEYDLDGNAVDARDRTSYLERFIHSEIYRARPDVRAVVHCHTASLIPFADSDVPLRAMYHMAAFVAEGVPVFDIRTAAGVTDLLVRDAALGKALAKSLGQKPAALMRGRCRRVDPQCRRSQHLSRRQREGASAGDRARRQDHVCRGRRSEAAHERYERVLARMGSVEA
jgi:ribulose-5-phosphate 4-epimerase/fuculose-1-phosphate aldolase